MEREEDNVYFVSWISQCLSRLLPLMSPEESSISKEILKNAKGCIPRYRSRYGGPAYNFYRADAWFPGGGIMHRFRLFQPTDDVDDTCMAYRALPETRQDMVGLKSFMEGHANGRRGKYLKRGPKSIRELPLHNTWLGSKDLYIDIDLVVLCNVLQFSADFQLPVSEIDRASLLFIRDSVRDGKHISHSWSISAWYPRQEVILYNLTELLISDRHPELACVKEQVIEELKELEGSADNAASQLLIQSSLDKLGSPSKTPYELNHLSDYLLKSNKFSWGHIPLLHPWDGRWAQFLSKGKLFRLQYSCPAQVLTILIENAMLRRLRS